MSFVGSDGSQRSMVYGSATSPRATRSSQNGSYIRRGDTDTTRVISVQGVDPLSLWNSPRHPPKPSPSDRMKFVINHAMTIEEAIEVSQEHTRVLQADIMKLQMELNDSLMRMESAVERADDAEAQVARLQVECHEFEWKMKAQHGVGEDQHHELSRLREQVTTLQRQVMTLQTERHLVTSERDRLEVTLDEDSRQRREDLQALQQEINRLNAKLSHTELSLSAATDAMTQLKMSNGKLRSEKEAHASQIAGLHDQLTKALKEKETAVIMAKKANFDSEDALQREAELAKRLAAVEQDRDKLREFSDDLATTLQMSSSKKDQVTNENRQLREELALLKAEMLKTSNNMAMLRVSADQAEKALERAQKAHQLEMAEQEEISTRKIQKVKVENTQRAVRHDTLAGVLDVTSRDLATTKTQLDRAMQHKQMVLSKVIRRMQNLTQLKGWNNWKDAVNEEKRLRAASAKILHRWIKRDSSKAFNTWLTQHQEVKRLQKTRAKILFRWMTKSLSQAFNTWVWRHGELSRLKTIKSKILARWMGKDVSRAFNSWLTQHQEVKRLQKTRAKILFRWMTKSLSQAFNTWVWRHGELSRLKTIKSKILARWMGKDVSRAFNSWVQQHRETRQRGSKLIRALKKWTNKGISTAWQSWVEQTTEARVARYKMARCVSMWVNGSLGRSLNTWHENSAKLAATRRATRNVVMRMKNRSLCMAFLAMADGAARQRESREKTRKILYRWTHLSVTSAFETWVGAIGEKKRLKALSKKALMRWTQGLGVQPTMIRVFNAWASMETSKDRMGAVVGRWLNSTLAAAFYTWEAAAGMETAATRHYQRAALRWANIWLIKAIHKWAEFVEDQKWEDQVKYRVLTRMLHVKTAGAFSRWKARAGERSEEMVSWRWSARWNDKKTTKWAWNAWVAKKVLVRQWHRMVASCCLILVQMEATLLLEGLEHPSLPPHSDVAAPKGLVDTVAEWGLTLEGTQLVWREGPADAVVKERGEETEALM